MSQPLSLDADTLLARAREVTGIDRIDDDAVAPLTVLLRSYRTESALHAQGATAFGDYLLRLLCNRLRMARDFAAHPEIAEQPIKAPVFVWGMPRTGSTKLQKLLAASGDFNWLSFWQSHNPSLLGGDRSASTQARIDDAEVFSQWFRAASPETQYTHPLNTHEPEEETFLLMHSLRTPVFMAFSDVSGYLQWLVSDDLGAQFRYLKQGLQYLQWQGLADPAKPWVLKSPLSYGMEPLVLATFPDAKLLMTHRHPSSSIPSFCSTIKSYYKPFSAAPIDYASKIGQLVWGLERHLDYRAAHPQVRILDIPYQEVIASVDHVTSRIYRFSGLERSDAALKAMSRWDADNPPDKAGAHRYGLADFGLSTEGIDAQFARYIPLLDAMIDRSAGRSK